MALRTEKVVTYDPANTSGWVAAQWGDLPRDRSVERGFFWNDPSDGTTATTIVDNYSLIVATKNKESWRESIVNHATTPRPVWQYILASEIRGSVGRLNNNVAWRDYISQTWINVDDDASGLVTTSPDWFLHNSLDAPIRSSNGTGATYYMDPANTDWRDFFVDQVVDYWTDYEPWDHIFLDNINRSIGSAAGGVAQEADGMTGADTTVKYKRGGTYTAYTNDAYTDGVAGFLAHLQTHLADVYGCQIWANIVEARNYDGASKYFPYLDGVMLERFATAFTSTNDFTSAAEWASDLALAESALAANTKVLAVGLGAQANTSLQNFSLASYLLIAEPGKTWFRYASNALYGQHWDYVNYQSALGRPVGQRSQISSNLWHRDYEFGFVQVNPVAETCQISVRQRPASGSRRTSLTAHGLNG